MLICSKVETDTDIFKKSCGSIQSCSDIQTACGACKWVSCLESKVDDELNSSITEAVQDREVGHISDLFDRCSDDTSLAKKTSLNDNDNEKQVIKKVINLDGPTREDKRKLAYACSMQMRSKKRTIEDDGDGGLVVGPVPDAKVLLPDGNFVKQRGNTGGLVHARSFRSDRGFVYLSLDEKEMDMYIKYSAEFPVNEDYEKIILYAESLTEIQAWRLAKTYKGVPLGTRVNATPGKLFSCITEYLKQCISVHKAKIYLKDIYVAPNFHISVGFLDRDEKVINLHETGQALDLDGMSFKMIGACDRRVVDAFRGKKMTTNVFSSAHDPANNVWITNIEA